MMRRKKPGICVKANIMFLRILLLTLLTAASGFAQNGDKQGEVQIPLVPADKIPASPVVPPDQALKTFKVAPGFHMELVASEPLVHDPIQIVFDPDGRLWVLEMSGYMPNADGKGEFEPKGKVVILEDTDGDGKMDKRTVFVDGLVMPRAISLVGGGVLVAEPPKLWFYRDTKGTGKADEKTEVAPDFATQDDPKLGLRASPEHASNGLLWTLDNWIYSANHTVRFRYTDGEWRHEPTIFRGQWGISQDDFGRLVYNSNSDQLRLDLVPSAYLSRNPLYRGAVGVNWQPQSNQAVWPIRVNPGVNRGYQRAQLRPDGTLATYTAACAPIIYRGDNFPKDCEGNAFLCEPAGNLVRRNILKEKDGYITAENAYDKAEFLASTDERFRPVNLSNGPDGALYVVDFYRGIIQHRIFLTTYLRQQGESRGLGAPIGLGRIYRVVADGRPLDQKPQLAKASTEDLVKALSHPNGWWRDTAQRLLVERSPAAALPLLKELATNGKSVFGRLHALWTLDGMGQTDAVTLLTVLKTEKELKIRAAAIRLSEPLLKGSDKDKLLPTILAEANKAPIDTQLQVAFTLGEIVDPQAEKVMTQIAWRNPTNSLIRDAVLTGTFQREMRFLEQVLADKEWQKKTAGTDRFLSGLAKCIYLGRKSEEIDRLLTLAAAPTTESWQQLAILDGIISTLPVASKGSPAVNPRIVRLKAEPAAWASLLATKDALAKKRFDRFADSIIWPGKPGAEKIPEIKPLSTEQQARFDAGKALFEASCAACHQLHGYGLDGLAPPLVDSEWVHGPDVRLSRIVLNGLGGPISVNGRKFDLDMPSLAIFDDEQIASILTYVRRGWGNTADAVDPKTVAKVRAAVQGRQDAWTAKELSGIK